MRNLVFIMLGVLLLFSGCNNTPEVVYTTNLSFFTPYQNFPEYLNGQLVSVEEMNYLASMVDGEIVKGELINKEIRDSLKLSSQNFTTYFNEDGEMTHIDYYYDVNDTRTWKVEYQNNMMTYAEFIRDDTVRSYYKIINDEYGSLSSSKFFLKNNDELRYTYKFNTNDKGFWTSAEQFNSEGEKVGSRVLVLDDNNLTTDYKVLNASDSLLSEVRCTYNDKGFYTKAVYMGGDGEIRRTNDIEYTKYDEKGNWLKSVIYNNGELMSICERKYEYYQ